MQAQPACAAIATRPTVRSARATSRSSKHRSTAQSARSNGWSNTANRRATAAAKRLHDLLEIGFHLRGIHRADVDGADDPSAIDEHRRGYGDHAIGLRKGPLVDRKRERQAERLDEPGHPRAVLLLVDPEHF